MRHALIAVSVMLVAPAATAQFTEASYSEAFDRAVKEDKLFLVHATAVWCGPCKMMDRDTYADDGVRAWMEANTVAVKVDVDEQPDRAEELGIRAMPTMVVFKGGKEFDRVTGYRGPDDFLGWLEDVKAGKSTLDALRESAGERPTDAEGRVDIGAQLEIARSLADARQYEAATDEYLWLWANMLTHSPGHSGVRLSFMTSEMRELVSQSNYARDAFTELRDDTESNLKQSPTWNDLRDWIQLNSEVIGDDDRVLAWVERNMADKAGRASIARMQLSVEPLLVKHGRWVELGTVIKRPTLRVRQQHMVLNAAHSASRNMGITDDLPDEVKARIDESMRREYEKVVASTAFALLAADRVDEAFETIKLSAELRPDWDLSIGFTEVSDAHPGLRDLVAPKLESRKDVPDALSEVLY